MTKAAKQWSIHSTQQAIRSSNEQSSPTNRRKSTSWVVRLVDSNDVEAILLTGGTGIAPRDQTPETLDKLITKNLPGYGELLRMLSYEEIGPAAMLSRACGGFDRPDRGANDARFDGSGTVGDGETNSARAGAFGGARERVDE